MQVMELHNLLKFLLKRPKDSHKGLFGHVLVIGGNKGFSGAARLAAEAALRIGAGAVTLATHPQHAAMININRPELMVAAISEPRELDPLLLRATVMLLGPGLGQDYWARAIFEKVVYSDKPLILKPLILDADGLNCLAEQPFKLKNAVSTPHPLEAARLLKTTVAEIQQNRCDAVEKLFECLGGVIVLKGANSLVRDYEGHLLQCVEGNPGMSSAGMGDVLAGIIAGLTAQGMPLDKAAALGVCLHAKAGDLAAQKGERGLIASDLFEHLRYLVNL